MPCNNNMNKQLLYDMLNNIGSKSKSTTVKKDITICTTFTCVAMGNIYMLPITKGTRKKFML